MTYDGPIIDAHIHQWDPRTTPRTATPAVKALGWSPALLHRLAERAFPAAMLDFVGDVELPLTPYLPGSWRADTRPWKVRGFVHVQADWQAKDPLDVVEETRWLEQVCGSDLLGIVGKAHLGSPSLDRVLDAHVAASSRFVGIRDYLAHGGDNEGLASFASQPDMTADGAWRRGFERLGERGLTFDAWAYGHQLSSVATLVSTLTDTTVVLDHLGSPVGWAGPYAGVGTTAGERDAILGRWREDLAAIGANPQVWVKVSGQGMQVSGVDWRDRRDRLTAEEVAEAYRPLVAHALEVVGPERCIIASNFPMDRVSLRWSTLYEAFSLLTEDLPPAQRQAMFHDNAVRAYGIPADDVPRG